MSSNPRTPSGEPAGPDVEAGTPVLAAVRAFAFDLDGTIYLQDRLLPGARRLIELLTERGIPHLFATNNSSRTGAAYVRHLTELGLSVSRERVLTSNDVAIAELRRQGLTRPYLVAGDEVAAEYAENGLRCTRDEADSVVLTFDTTLTYDKLRHADRLIRGGLPYFATHPDRVCPTLSGPIPDCGAFIALLHASTGAVPRILGKPEAPMAAALQERSAVEAHELAFVGDRLYTDVRMANRHGFVAVLTLTGEARRGDLDGGEDRPDLVVESLEELVARLAPDADGAAAGRGSRR